MVRICTVIVFCSTALFPMALARADVVYLQNGDRITGAFAAMSGDAVTIGTEYAGELTIARPQILFIETDTPVFITTRGGITWQGRLQTLDGEQVFVTEDGHVPLPLGEVAAIDVPAQETVAEPTPEEAPPVEEKIWKGNFSLGASWRSGTTDRTESTAKLQLTRKVPKHTLTLNFKAGYGEVDGNVNTRQLGGEGKWQYYPKDRLYVYGLGGAEHDPAKKLELRANLAAGAGYDFIAKPRIKLAGDLGLDYAQAYWKSYDLASEDGIRAAAWRTQWNLIQAYVLDVVRSPVDLTGRTISFVRSMDGAEYRNTTERESDLNLRASLAYEHQVLKASTISESLVVLPEIDDWSNYRLTSDFAFSTPLSEKLSLRLNLQSEYDSEPQNSVNDWDHAFFATVQYSF
ncbi:MAG: autotransporter outer membrane beta-barrel domain-containing protein [Candidatus Hydrogenedentes bacterium]|nr:autotransporter outer membrane beta-barrel domain-containing protein [Candidatus Hydrogenedentota bacterium]